MIATAKLRSVKIPKTVRMVDIVLDCYTLKHAKYIIKTDNGINMKRQITWYEKKRDEMFNAYQAVLDDATLTDDVRAEQSEHYMNEYENYVRLCGGLR